MKKRNMNNKGFTLVELMITIIIIGVLASVAIPLYYSNVKKAKASEADSALGTIRTAMRLFYAEYGRYPISTSFSAMTGIIDSLDIDTLDISGRYFKAGAYTYKSLSSATKFEIRAQGSGQANNINRQMDQTGTLSDW